MKEAFSHFGFVWFGFWFIIGLKADDAPLLVGVSLQQLNPHVRVWDSVSLNTLHVLGIGFFDRALVCLAFSKSVRKQQRHASQGHFHMFVLCFLSTILNIDINIWTFLSGRMEGTCCAL